MHELEKRADQHRLQALRKISALSQETVSGEETLQENKQSLATRVAKKIETLRSRFSS
jgi:transcription initiation factor TFIID subunit TAF12